MFNQFRTRMEPFFPAKKRKKGGGGNWMERSGGGPRNARSGPRNEKRVFVFHIRDFPFDSLVPSFQFRSSAFSLSRPPLPKQPPSSLSRLTPGIFRAPLAPVASRWYSNFNLFPAKRKNLVEGKKIFLVFLLGCFHFLTFLLMN